MPETPKLKLEAGKEGNWEIGDVPDILTGTLTPSRALTFAKLT